ncbi:methylated-DNA--protein-cysteine methyltransferase isoform X1 [Eucyclogobius newberryi]|uniref:methylated-DNA--protein-cysteine methyltransferase isoform X1 n=1 Tax=Eucyclogobius newberryi TaxID=166745 RepID=UPI003B5BB0AE
MNTVRAAKQGGEMKKLRESQCTQKTISLLSPLGKIQVSGCENGVHTIRFLMDVAPAERSGAGPLSCCVVNDSPGETSPQLQRCVQWLQAYFSSPRTTGTLPLPTFHHPALQGGSPPHPVPPRHLQQRTERPVHGRQGQPPKTMAAHPREAVRGKLPTQLSFSQYYTDTHIKHKATEQNTTINFSPFGTRCGTIAATCKYSLYIPLFLFFTIQPKNRVAT